MVEASLAIGVFGQCAHVYSPPCFLHHHHSSSSPHHAALRMLLPRRSCYSLWLAAHPLARASLTSAKSTGPPWGLSAMHPSQTCSSTSKCTRRWWSTPTSLLTCASQEHTSSGVGLGRFAMCGCKPRAAETAIRDQQLGSYEQACNACILDLEQHGCMLNVAYHWCIAACILNSL